MLGERDVVIFQQNEKIIELQTANEQAGKAMAKFLEENEGLKKQLGEG